MTQKERIVKYIDDYGSISPLEAFRDLGVTKLATKISEMRRDGQDFDQKYEKAQNRFGETVYYMRYYRKGALHE